MADQPTDEHDGRRHEEAGEHVKDRRPGHGVGVCSRVMPGAGS
jgi:hypothetical protein